MTAPSSPVPAVERIELPRGWYFQQLNPPHGILYALRTPKGRGFGVNGTGMSVGRPVVEAFVAAMVPPKLEPDGTVTLSQPDRKSVFTIGQEVAGSSEQDGNATNEQLLAKLDIATYKRSLVVSADDVLWAPAHGAVCDARAAVLARMSTPTPGRAAETDTMGEVEDLVDTFGMKSRHVGEHRDARYLPPEHDAELAKDDLLSAVSTIVTERDAARTRAETAEAQLATLRAEVEGRPVDHIRRYPGGRTKEEWDPIGKASLVSNPELPED